MNYIIFYLAWIVGIHILVKCFVSNNFFHAIVALLTVAALAFVTRQHLELLKDEKQGDCRDY
jgi:FtsH-binding integral membrane protein